MALSSDLREFIGLLNTHGVEYLIIGGHALAFYGCPRFTGDVDFFYRCSSGNANRLEKVVEDFGFKGTGLAAGDFLAENQVIQLGVAPYRLDLVSGIDGVLFEQAWEKRVEAVLDGIPVHYISREHLIENKRATGRPQDLVDVQSLKAVKGYRP